MKFQDFKPIHEDVPRCQECTSTDVLEEDGYFICATCGFTERLR